MNIAAIQDKPIPLSNPERIASQSESSSFGHLLSDALSHCNDQLLTADKALQALARGKAPNLHQCMLQLEEAKLSFQFLEQVRSRLMGAYQEILREQI